MWDEEKDAFVIGLRRSGLTLAGITRQVCERFGVVVSRNAVIGRLHRLRARGVDIGELRPEPEAIVKGRAAAKERARSARASGGRKAWGQADHGAWLGVRLRVGSGVSLVNVSRKQCCYPLWGDEAGAGVASGWPVCGKAVVRKTRTAKTEEGKVQIVGETDEWSSWCAEHHARIVK